MISCNELWEKEKELKKYSIFLLNDDFKDKDFDFFIFIDPDNQEDRPPFLKELFNIIDKSNGREFALPEHRKELKEWIGTKDDNDFYLTPLNWLKISIERYPYRLIVMTNNIPKEKLKKIEFINKRICFVSKIDLLNRIDNEYENLFLSIYFIWIDHILTNIRNKIVKDLILLYITDIEKSCPYIPETLPDIYKRYLNNKRDSGIRPETTTNKIIINISLSEKDIIKISDDQLKKIKSYLLIFLNRHKNFFWIDNDNKLRTSYNKYMKELIYSENISGGLSFFNQIQESIEEPSKYSSKIFLIRYIENSLLRIGICDERFQEWWGLKDNNKAGSIVQSRVIPFYIEDKSKYAQKPINGNIFYTIMRDKKLYIYPENKDQDNPQEKDLRNIWSLNNDGKIDFLIIHQGILDEWQENNKSKEILTRKILEIKDVIPFVICTSGRGMPDNLPYGVKFIPFSSIEGSMVGDYFEKFTLLRQVLKLI